MYPVINQARDKQATLNRKSIQSIPSLNVRIKPKFFNYLKYVLLLVFIIILSAQLRAIELPNSASGPACFKPKILIEYKGDLLAHTHNATRLNTIKSPPQVKFNNVEQQTDKELNNFKPNKNVSEQKLFKNFQSSSNQSNLATINDLLVEQTSNNAQVRHIAPINYSQEHDPQEANSKLDQVAANSLGENENRPNELGTNLAELTAAGTAAGLMVHDLLSQANMPQHDQIIGYNNLPTLSINPLDIDKNSIAIPISAASKLNEEESDDDDDGDSIGGSAPRRAINKQQKGQWNYLQQQQQQQQQAAIASPAAVRSNNELGDEDESNVDAGEGPKGNMHMLEQQQHPFAQEGDVGDEGQQQQLEKASSNPAESGPEPPGEEQMPDSMDGLMRSEGENIDTGGGGDGDDGQVNSVSGTNLVNNNIMQPAQRRQLKQLESSEFFNNIGGSDDDDDGDANEAQDTQLQANHLSSPSSSSYNSIPRSIDHEQLLRNPSGINNQLDGNLLEPVRDSLSDLNTAAGHYYGKKKKKKVKKIVIKKNQKKKYAKKKKVKVIVKKKKKKKSPKKIKKHHHDHGKYYMYAKVPKKKSWEFGFKKGNKKHWIMRHEKGHKNKFKTKVKWYDKKSKGKGVHIWDYNHHDKKKKKHY